MAFKRKASFSAIVSPITPGTVPGDSPTIDETPKHLNSRTRKRFRDNRPSDEVVYDNTLRWLFSAQQRPQQSNPPPVDEDTNQDTDAECLPSPETLDPRQQTLYKFFQPAQPSSFRYKASNQSPKETSEFVVRESVTPGHAPYVNSAVGSIASDTNSSNNQAMDSGMNSGMDIGD